jgi:hypothetical protein
MTGLRSAYVHGPAEVYSDAVGATPAIDLCELRRHRFNGAASKRWMSTFRLMLLEYKRRRDFLL